MLSVYESLNPNAVMLLAAQTLIVMVSIIVIVFILMLLAAASLAIQNALRGKNKLPKEEAMEEEANLDIEDIMISDEEKKSLQNIFDYKGEERRKEFEEQGVKVPQGYILHDQSGCDSAKILRSLACNAKNSFINFSVEKCKEQCRLQQYYDAINALRNTFEQAKKDAPCVIWIDRIDLVCQEGSQNGTINRLITDELLSEMKKLKSHQNVTVIARASHPEILDSELAKYLPEVIKIGLPNPELRKKALTRYIHNDKIKPSLSEKDLEKFAEDSDGMSISDIEHLAGRVKFHAVEDKKSSITLDEVQNEIEKLKDEQRNREKAIIEQHTHLGRDKNVFDVIKKDENGPKLADVIVSEEVRDELKMICNQTSDVFKAILEKLGYKQNKGYILYGPPGTGKTMIARAIANECNRAFISVSGPDFERNFSGQGACFAADLFDTAQENTPCIIFIDEIDSIGRKRGQSSCGGSQERDATLNQLLHRMDGFSDRGDVIVIVATNRPEILDPALTRRLSKPIEIGLPGEHERKQMLNLHTKKAECITTNNLSLKGQKYLANAEPMTGEDREDIAKLTDGFSGADIEYLMNEAKFSAACRIFQEIHPDPALEKINDDKIFVAKYDIECALAKLKAQKEKSAKTNITEAQVSGIDLFKYLSQMPVAPCENCSASMRLR